MALDNFANLKQSIETWTHRNDIDLLAEDCIVLCEQYLYAGDLPLKVGELETVDTVSINAQSSALPTGLIEFRDVRIQYDGTYFQLTAMPPTELPEHAESGRPAYYTVGGTFYLDREPDQAYTVKRRYYARPTALSDVNPTNAILTAYPHLYLWGCMAAAFSYAREEELMQVYGERLRQSILDANQAYMTRSMGAMPTIRIRGNIP